MNQITPSLSQWIKTKSPVSPSVRLELFNRLDNLCELSGLKMTDKLRGELEVKFGLEFVKVIEGFEDIEIPRLADELQRAIVRFFPSAYRLEAERLFSRVCGPTGPALVMEYSDIGLCPVSPVDSLAAWNNRIVDSGTPYDDISVDGNTVKLYGGANIVMKANGFQSDTGIINIDDETNSIVELLSSGFVDADYLEYARLNGVITAADSVFFDVQSALTLIMQNCTAIGPLFFVGSNFLVLVDLRNCTNFGGTVGDNNVFQTNNGNTGEYILPVVLETCDAGGPDGDLVILMGSNPGATITYV